MGEICQTNYDDVFASMVQLRHSTDMLEQSRFGTEEDRMRESPG